MYYWDVMFTFIDTTQLLLWFKMKEKYNLWENEDIEELNNLLNEWREDDDYEILEAEWDLNPNYTEYIQSKYTDLSEKDFVDFMEKTTTKDRVNLLKSSLQV